MPAQVHALRSGAMSLPNLSHTLGIFPTATRIDIGSGRTTMERNCDIESDPPFLVPVSNREIVMAKSSSGGSRDFEAALWAAADKLRGTLDAAEYKHVVLGLIFLKYISDSFEDRRGELARLSRDKE